MHEMWGSNDGTYLGYACNEALFRFLTSGIHDGELGAEVTKRIAEYTPHFTCNELSDRNWEEAIHL